MSRPAIGGLTRREKEALLARLLADRSSWPRRVPASFAQERLWFLDRLQPGSGAYNVVAAVRVEGALAYPALVRALEQVAHRHDTLRTTFAETEGGLVQVVAPRPSVRMPVVDLTGLPEVDRAEEVRELVRREGRRPFDLATGPLLRTSLLRLGEARSVVFVSQHHAVSDAWSLGVFVRELAACYGAAATGRREALEPLPIQYGDYARWQREHLAGERLEAQLSYWTETLADAPRGLDLPADRTRPAVRSHRGGDRRFHLGRGLAARLRGLVLQGGATPFMGFLTAWGAYLARWTGRLDLCIGTPVANRDRPEFEGLIGPLINTLVLRLRIDERAGFRPLLDGVRRTTLEVYRNQDAPFEALVDRLQPERDPSVSPLFQVMLVFQSRPLAEIEVAGLTLAPVEAASRTAKLDLTLEVSEDDEGFQGRLEYSADLFDATTVARVATHFRTLLEAAVKEPERPLGSLPVMTPPEEHQLLVEWNDTAADQGAPASLQELLVRQAARTPDAVAVVADGAALSYAELFRRGVAFARRLEDMGVAAEGVVAVGLDRSRELLVALVGVLLRGAAFLPLDRTYPEERRSYMLADCGACALVAGEGEGVAAGPPPVPAPASAPSASSGGGTPAEPAPAAPAAPAGLAYVLYTSGSTGQPKGVMGVQEALVNRLAWMVETYGFRDGDRILQKTPTSFDVSLWELFGPLLAGAVLVFARPGAHGDAGYLAEVVARERVTTLHFVPSMLEAFLDEPRADLAPVRRVVASGEALSAPLAERFLERFGPRLHNLYGPTEAAVEVSFEPCTAVPDRATVPIGRPIANVVLHVTDAGLRAVALGVAGELQIGGVALARGYLRRAAATAERFVPDPFAGGPGRRLYRTGDLVRRLADGRLEFLGRLDHQVKIRGVRIELGEVETALLEHPSVREGVVLPVAGSGGDRRLHAFVVPAGEPPGPAELREHLRGRLPEAMVPAAFVLLDALPHGPSGKVDRRALAQLDAPSADPAGARTPPRDPVEEVVAGIWGGLLGSGPVGVHESFFERGGHSLLATRMMSRVREAFGVDVPLLRFFEAPTVAALAGRIQGAASPTGAPARPPLRPRPRAPKEPLSFAQQRLWFLQELEPGGSAYNVAAALRLTGALNVELLHQVFSEIVRRHEVLRTRFVAREGQPFQVVEPARGVALRVLDLSELPGREEAVRAWLRSEARRGFDLAVGPLIRLGLARVAQDDHVLVVTMHHIVSDAWSSGVVVEEAVRLYQAWARGRRSPLPELPVQYADYIAWQREWLEGGALESGLAYWRRRLEGAPHTLQLRGDRPRPAVQTFRGGSRPVRVPPELWSRVRRLGAARGATQFMVLTAAFGAVLGRHAGQDDLLLGTPVAGRTHPDLEGLIGFFVNTLVLRLEMDGAPGFRELLGRVRRTALEAYAHQDVPFERLVDALGVERTLRHAALFQAMLVLQNAPKGRLELEEVDLTVRPVEVAPGTAKFDLVLALDEGDADLGGTLVYNADLFDATSAERLVGHWLRLLDEGTGDPERPVRQLSLLAPAERQQVLVEWNDAARPGPLPPVHELVAAWADRAPDAVAAACDGRQLSYRELDRRARRLAARLRARGAGPEGIVATLLPRSLETVVAFLGVARSGAAILVLDVSDPPERTARLLATARPAAVLVGPGSPQAPASAAPGPILDVMAPGPAGAPAPPPGPRLPEHPAYAIFTSGSTGEPKGILVSHDALANHMAWLQEDFPLAPDDAVLHKTPFAFDPSVGELWAPLIDGARLVLGREGLHRDPGRLGKRLARERSATLQVVPSLLEALASEPGGGGDVPGLRRIYCGGEALEADLASRAARRFRVPVHNLYGPAEATIHATAWTASGRDGGRAVPIGRSIRNVATYVLSEALEPVPVGVAGELLICGRGLARCYLHRPADTARSFVPDPFEAAPGGRLYRSGDLVRRLAGGEIEFLERLDRQVKLRGHRIEPAEIEAALARAEGVEEAAVILDRAPAGPRLVAFYARHPGVELGAAELREELRRRLPPSMVPALFVELEGLPRTAGGKIDRRRLVVPDTAPPDGSTARTAPRTPVETALAGIWAEALGLERVGVHDDFFELGGHSLLATRIVARIKRDLGARVAVREVFVRPTVAAMAALVAGADGSPEGGLGEAPDGEEDEELLELLDELEGLSDDEARRRLAAVGGHEPPAGRDDG